MTNSVALPHSAHGAASQSTMIEGNRVAAEVYAAILVAQQVPRDLEEVQREMEQLCRMPAMARKAIYKVPKGGKTATGPTIHLMKELARIWGNTQWGMAELSRSAGKSELLAYAWDAQKNSRSSRIVVVEHKRDKSETGPEDITDMAAIMTNNTSIASRHLRETIATILPLWFVDRAVELCMATMTGGGSVPLPQKIRNAVARFEEELKVRKERLVARLGGRPTSEWDALDLAELLEAYSRVTSGAVPVDVEFPPPAAVATPVTLPAVTSDADDATPAAVAEAPTDVEALPEDPAARLQMMFDLFIAAGIGTTPAERQKRLRIITRCLTLPTPLGSVNDLTTEQVGELITFMARRRVEGDLSSTLEEMGEVKLPDPPADPVGD
jgi:hypothetical protein